MSMPPTLIFDKSVLQFLSYDECLELSERYYFVTTPVLIMEIVNDRLKYRKDDKKSVITDSLLSKLKAHRYLMAFLTHSHIELLYTELSTGNRVPMEGKAVRPDIQITSTPGVGKGLYLDLSNESEIYDRWKHSGLNDYEQELSQRCIESLNVKEDDWEKLKEMHDFPEFPQISGEYLETSRAELKMVTTNFCEREDVEGKFENLRLILNSTLSSEDAKTEIIKRWLDEKMPPLKCFSPYSYHCLQVFVAFYIAIENKMKISESRSKQRRKKSKNRIDFSNLMDVLYLLYLPFCQTFTSNDIFLSEFAKIFISSDQNFISGDEIKGSCTNATHQ